MEDNNDMPSASETQPIGEIGEEEIPDPMSIFGNDECNGISQGGLFLQTFRGDIYIYKVLSLSSLSPASVVGRYG